MVFTASEKKYADMVVDLLDPEFKFFNNVCYRHQCDLQGPLAVKDLRSLSTLHTSVSDMLILDNRLASFAYQLYNGVPILPFYGSSSSAKDRELLDIQSFLKYLSNREVDITKSLRERYNYRKVLDYAHE